jgi:hypothetical protein
MANTNTKKSGSSDFQAEAGTKVENQTALSPEAQEALNKKIEESPHAEDQTGEQPAAIVTASGTADFQAEAWKGSGKTPAATTSTDFQQQAGTKR